MGPPVEYNLVAVAEDEEATRPEVKAVTLDVPVEVTPSTSDTANGHWRTIQLVDFVGF
jgi:hypothetical protein